MNDLPALKSGSQPVDDGNYILDAEECEALISCEPGAEKFICPYVGSREFLQGRRRWIIAVQAATPAELRVLPSVVERMRAVKTFRLKSQRKGTLAIANYPERFNFEVIPVRPFLVIPKVSSERRSYIPIGWLEPPTIPSDLVFVLPTATKAHFAMLSSAMHMSWVRHIGGRLKSDYRYSIGLVYNTFPMPVISPKQQNNLTTLVDAVLTARAKFTDSSLSDLYDPDLMPTKLRKAHDALDRAVDRLYRRAAFKSDRERAEHLFGLYERMVAPLEASIGKKKRTRRRKATA